MKNKKVALLILDGWGIGNGKHSDAIKNANTPVMDKLLAENPNSTLRTDGLNVGLPEGQMGNSEVGHLNIGAGRVVYQELVRINNSIEQHTIDKNEVLLEAFKKAKSGNRKLHYFGLVSDGCIHSSEKHLFRLCELAAENGLENVIVHAFTDGRDTDPKSGIRFITELNSVLEKTGGVLATIVGRYYAMDRDKRWERVKVAYDSMVNRVGEASENMLSTIKSRYESGETDEFLMPIINPKQGLAIEDGDVVISFNYRTDRCREISEVLSQTDMPDLGMKKLDIDYITLTTYDETFKNVKVIFTKDDLSDTLGDVLSKQGSTQLRIAETEKYPHVTFFFSGGREAPFEGEERIMIQSPKVSTYDLQPEMSAYGIQDAAIANIREKQPDFICLNFANADMVGHTGVYDAIVKAVETVDKCLGEVVETLREFNYSIIVIADHGNADFAVNEDGSPNTAHTTNPVPCILIDKDYSSLRSGKLADIAPTILTIMQKNIPVIMNGDILV
ncbi:MAG: 2,3-bisphosphoglycerate-independent phosphoglycerate mutase [Bacteroidia bacterium]